MNKVFRTFLALVIAIFAQSAYAQIGNFLAKNIVTDYDLDSTTEVFVATGSIGTAAGSGAFPIFRNDKTTITITVTQSDATGGVDSRILCRVSGSAEWLQAYPELTPGTVTPSYVNIATTGSWGKEVNGIYYQCRVGLKINTADPSDAGSNVEKISIIEGHRG